eukprot:7301169-Prorocentrum_lima.AAC.1
MRVMQLFAMTPLHSSGLENSVLGSLRPPAGRCGSPRFPQSTIQRCLCNAHVRGEMLELLFH